MEKEKARFIVKGTAENRRVIIKKRPSSGAISSWQFSKHAHWIIEPLHGSTPLFDFHSKTSVKGDLKTQLIFWSSPLFLVL